MKARKSLKLWIAVFAMALAFAGALKAEAAAFVPAVPTGIEIYSQEGKKLGVGADLDQSLIAAYSNYVIDGFGWEVLITNAKGKAIAQQEFSVNTTSLYDSNTKIWWLFQNSKFQTNALKVSVRAYTADSTGAKLYSEWSPAKVLVPRATVTKKKLVGGKVKLTWKKVTGAKDYTVYLSSNDGISFKKLGTVKGSSYTITKSLKKYKNYYVYVKANNVKVGKKKYSSSKPYMKEANTSGFIIRTVYK